MCLSKALTAGLIPMGITTCNQKVYDAFYDDAITKGFFHGHTYSANPLCCAAAIAGIELLTSAAIQKQIEWLIEAHKEFDKKIANHNLVANTRQCGIIYAIDLDLEIDRYGGKRDEIFNFFMQQGVFLRPLGNTIYIHPPYVISKTELNTIYNAIQNYLIFLES
jgi:adenosylmethionine-8-amino-7-oxononanoate aminotransferase